MAQQFYKYADNPTVYRGSDNYAFSSWDEFTKAGGTSGGIETRTAAPTNFYVGTPPANNAVTVNQLTPAAQVTLPPVPPKDTSGATAALETGSKSIEQYMKEATAPETETSKQQASYIKDLNVLGADLGGKKSALAAEEEKQGVGILSKELAGLNSQILTGVAELKQMQDAETKAMVDAEGKVIPLAAISGEQARIQRQQAVLRLTKQSDIGLLQARALGMQGQVESAKATAARAIDLRYEAKEDEYDLKLRQLELIQPLLDKEQKIQATALERKYEDEQQVIADRKAVEKRNVELALEAGLTTKFYNYGGEVRDTASGYAYTSEQDFTQKTGITLQEAYGRGQVGNYDPNLQTSKSLVADLITRYPDSGIQITDSLEAAQSKLSRSRIYQDQVRAPIGSGGGGGGSSSGGISGSTGGTYGSDLDAMVGTVLSTIPSKFGQQTFRDEVAKARDDADRVNILAAQVLKGQPAEFKNDFRNQAVGISSIDKAIAELDRGVKTGVIQNGAQYVYNVFGKDFDPKLAAINSYITSAIQPYRNSVTGAAWGEQEDQEYSQLFGSTKYSPAELKQRLLQTKELLKSKSSAGLNAFVNPIGSYDNVFDTGTLTPAPPITFETPTAQTITTPEAKGWWDKTTNWLWGAD